MRNIIILAFIGFAMALPRNPNRIIGGEPTTIEKYPFMSLMIRNVSPGCGGTLITSTAILSAAHCYVRDPPTIWKVRLGSTYSASGGNEHIISKIITHENYSGTGYMVNDIAIVKLTNPAVFSDKINTARIAGPSYILPDNTPVHAIGWGAIRIHGTMSDVLRHVEVNTINHKICTDRYAFLKSLPGMLYLPDVTPEMLCTGILNVGGKDTCPGDSGGPVIHNGDVVIGITSWGLRCGSRLVPGVNARVSSYADWIYTNSLD